jgi:hypothetical protein
MMCTFKPEKFCRTLENFEVQSTTTLTLFFLFFHSRMSVFCTSFGKFLVNSENLACVFK